MTLKELLHEVSALVFMEHPKDDDTLVYAANRATRFIFADLPTEKRVRLHTRGKLPATRLGDLTHKGGSTVCLPISGKAYSMRLVGKGSYTLRDSSGEITTDFNAAGEIFSGFFAGEGEILFSGDYLFTVKDLVTYSEIYSDKIADIPDGTEICNFDMRVLFSDFQSFASDAKDINGNSIEGAELSGSVIALPRGYSGDIFISYNRLPRKIYAEDKGNDIDVPEEYSPLLPLLTAYYILLDDEPDTAEVYLSRYREAVTHLKVRHTGSTAIGYNDTNGWA